MKSEAAHSNNTDTGQLSTEAAKIYEDFFVPALFQEWAERLLEAAKIKKGDYVLDVACGTGILTRTIAAHIKPGGKVVGLDLNGGMLGVAAQIAPEVEYKLGAAEALPFADEEFDAVVSQFGLMFFTDRLQALQEMMRVLKPRGQLAVAVWDSLDHSPGYKALVNLLKRLFGDQVSALLHTPFALADTHQLLQLFEHAGVPSPSLITIQGMARFPSISAWLYTEVKGWTMRDMITDQQFEELLSEAETALRSFVNSDGTVSFAMPAHIVTAQKV